MRNTFRAFLLSFSAAWLTVTASAASGGSFSLAEIYPLDLEVSASEASAWAAANATAVYPINGGYINTGVPGEAPAARTEFGQVVYRLSHASCGMAISELKSDFCIGDYCSFMPISDTSQIDWPATREAIRSSEAYTQGYLFFVDSATNDLTRILFTRGGMTTVPWRLKDGSKLDRTYTVSQSANARPYRLFWTETPFHGPFVDLKGKFVRLFGDPAIVRPVYRPSTAAGISNIVRGVVIDTSAQALRAYCEVKDVDNQIFDGPEGQFVLAYYDSGKMDTLLGTIVVEVSGPDITIVKASVGDELRPTGLGYDITGLRPYVQSGLDEVESDPASPYIYNHHGNFDYSPRNNAIFAIAPTDETVGNGRTVEWKADVYWEIPDRLGTLWPFEEVQYLISWGADTPKVVSDDSGGADASPLFPTNYTVSLMDYAAPAGFARYDQTSNRLITKDTGFCLLKLTAEDNIWFMPIHSVLNTDTNYFDLTPADWFVGNEITLRGGAAAGTQKATADGSLPGHINESVSIGRNWNPRLYRRPTVKKATDAAETPANNSDPYAALTSSIYAVNASDDPIEVWWFDRFGYDDMPTDILYPSVVQRYRAVWPAPGDCPEIVLASGLGSAAKSIANYGQSLYLNAAGVGAAVTPFSVNPVNGLSVSLWLNPQPSQASAAGWTPGPLLSLDNFAGRALRISLEADRTVTCSFNAPAGGETVTLHGNQPIPTNAWTFIAFTLAPSNISDSVVWRVGMIQNLNEAAAESCSGIESQAVTVTNAVLGGGTVTGTALDSFRVWKTALSPTSVRSEWLGVDDMDDVRSSLVLSFDFDGPDDLNVVSDGVLRYAEDPVSGNALSGAGLLAMLPGAPRYQALSPTVSDGITPAVYFENRSDRTGYNPNEEHALLINAGDSYVAYALRNDLNGTGASQPFVLAQFNSAGKGAMQIYRVVETNADYPSFASAAPVGSRLDGVKPLSLLQGSVNDKNFTLPLSNEVSVIYRGQNLAMWARCAGVADLYSYYPVQPGFAFPMLDEASWPAAETIIPWLSCRHAATPTKDLILKGRPEPWRWTFTWPSDDAIPVMKIGQTLTKAKGGLPEVWNASSMAVVYPVAEDTGSGIVRLIDPTVAQSVGLAVTSSMPDEYGFTVGPSGTCFRRGTKYYFTGLPPSISDRFYYDLSAPPSANLTLIGNYVEKTAGTSYLQLNTLTSAERDALKAICKTSDGTRKTAWDAAVNSLATKEVIPTTAAAVKNSITPAAVGGGTEVIETKQISISYQPVDHYALTATGEGTGYAVLIENDATNRALVADGSPVSLHVVKVVPELYAGSLITLEDSNNKLSEQLGILYTEPFGAAVTNYVFEWRRRTPPSDGAVPTNYPDFNRYREDSGLTGINLGGTGSTMSELVNTYYVMRYRAAPGTAAARTLGTNTWSDWCGPTLAEGWIQRVLKNVTPFDQRIDDFYNNPTEVKISMLEQIGGPFEGDVALNNDNLNNIGLLQLYQTVLNKAESMSLAVGEKNPDVNKQLLEAVSRLADLYRLLGDEAYSDAKNPTISMKTLYEVPSVLFCFDNQLSSLLDEELALLRGRSRAVAPSTATSPFYNRLMWNFTTGITEGQLAYVMNYNIQGNNGEITAEAAAKMFPQGHGDAWGHWLSALSGYYRLLRNPNFEWGEPSMMEMLVADHIVNMDYEDEQKFAEIAAQLVKAGADVLDLTSRKAWRDGGGVPGAGYFDKDPEQAFGYGEWGVRTGLAAIYTWATVNSLLPDSVSNSVSLFTDDSIADIDRSKVPALASLATLMTSLQDRMDTIDAGFNPLGFSDHAVPFDIDPDLLQKHTSHFEQILERAEKAVANAEKTLAYAQVYGCRLRYWGDVEGSSESSFETSEAAYNKKLVAIYGYPFADDIGPAGTYPQGYEGPDFYHYMWMDLGPYGLPQDVLDTSLSTTVTVYKTSSSSSTYDLVHEVDTNTTIEIKIDYTVSPGGLVVKPSRIAGTRRAEGKIQSAYRDYLVAYSKLRQLMTVYESKVNKLTGIETQIASAKYDWAVTSLTFHEIVNAAKEFYAGVKLATTISLAGLDVIDETVDNATDVSFRSTPKIIGAGLTVNVDPSAVVGAVGGIAKTTTEAATATTRFGAKSIDASTQFWLTTAELLFDSIEQGSAYYDTLVSIHDRIVSGVNDVRTAAYDLQNGYAALVQAEQAYRSVLAEGDEILAEREMVRRQQSNTMTAARYADMYNRIQHNAALSQYTAAFDLAQRYVYLAARAYDYETGLASDDSGSGDAFMCEIVAARSLGRADIAVEAGRSGSSLYDCLTRMKANFTARKGSLGLNNPDSQTTWFSLRRECLRIKPGLAGDAAWREALQSYRVDDILSLPEFTRYCRPPESANGLNAKEPGLVIPFSTSINFGENLFGRPLAGGDSAFSSSDFATKIFAAGIRFRDYNTAAGSYSGTMALANTPNIYLVPVGSDKMRAPSASAGTVLNYKVVDQVIPLPYTVGETELTSPDWVSLFNGYDGTADSLATIRRFSTLRAGDAVSSSRLVGRSVWNDRWLLIIPAGSLGADRMAALDAFINGADLTKDGMTDQKPVSDIEVGFKTYSHGGM